VLAHAGEASFTRPLDQVLVEAVPPPHMTWLTLSLFQTPTFFVGFCRPPALALHVCSYFPAPFSIPSRAGWRVLVARLFWPSRVPPPNPIYPLSYSPLTSQALEDDSIVVTGLLAGFLSGLAAV